jgi:hypothetical protein
MGRSFREFLPSFALLYVGMLVLSAIAGWKDAIYYNLEAALVTLIGGLIIANIVKIRAAVAARLKAIETGVMSQLEFPAS